MNPPNYSQSNYWINILKIEKGYKLSKNKLLKNLFQKIFKQDQFGFQIICKNLIKNIKHIKYN